MRVRRARAIYITIVLGFGDHTYPEHKNNKFRDAYRHN